MGVNGVGGYGFVVMTHQISNPQKIPCGQPEDPYYGANQEDQTAGGLLYSTDPYTRAFEGVAVTPQGSSASKERSKEKNMTA